MYDNSNLNAIFVQLILRVIPLYNRMYFSCIQHPWKPCSALQKINLLDWVFSLQIMEEMNVDLKLRRVDYARVRY